MQDYSHLTTEQKALEYIKCKNNIFYFIFNYVYIPEIGGSLKYTPEHMHAKLRRVVRSAIKFDKVMFMASRQLGKALDINTPIPLPNGKWTTMGDLQVGDTILGENGKPTVVIAATDIMYNHDCYRIEFDYVDPIIADADHLWKIDYIDKILTTYELLNYQNISITSYYPIKKEHKIINIVKVDSVPVRCIQVDNPSKMFLCGHFIPTHNSTIAAAIIEYMMNFYPRNRAIIINMKKSAALENLGKIKFIHEMLPLFLKLGASNRQIADRKTYLEYENGSRVDVFYPSTTSGPEQIARSMTSPILYIDRFCR
jgi:hypothetical protein